MRLVFFFIGLVLWITGCTYFILYLNLLTMGYSLLDFLKYIILGYPGVLSISGLSLIIITIFKRRMIKKWILFMTYF